MIRIYNGAVSSGGVNGSIVDDSNKITAVCKAGIFASYRELSKRKHGKYETLTYEQIECGEFGDTMESSAKVMGSTRLKARGFSKKIPSAHARVKATMKAKAIQKGALEIAFTASSSVKAIQSINVMVKANLEGNTHIVAVCEVNVSRRLRFKAGTTTTASAKMLQVIKQTASITSDSETKAKYDVFIVLKSNVKTSSIITAKPIMVKRRPSDSYTQVIIVKGSNEEVLFNQLVELNYYKIEDYEDSVYAELSRSWGDLSYSKRFKRNYRADFIKEY